MHLCNYFNLIANQATGGGDSEHVSPAGHQWGLRKETHGGETDGRHGHALIFQ